MKISHLLIKKTFRKLDNYNHLYVASIFQQWHSQTHCLINSHIIPRVEKWKPFKQYSEMAKNTIHWLKKSHIHLFVCLYLHLFIYLVSLQDVISRKTLLCLLRSYERFREFLNTLVSKNSIMFSKNLNKYF